MGRCVLAAQHFVRAGAGCERGGALLLCRAPGVPGLHASGRRVQLRMSLTWLVDQCRPLKAAQHACATPPLPRATPDSPVRASTRGARRAPACMLDHVDDALRIPRLLNASTHTHAYGLRCVADIGHAQRMPEVVWGVDESLSLRTIAGAVLLPGVFVERSLAGVRSLALSVHTQLYSYAHAQTPVPTHAYTPTPCIHTHTRHPRTYPHAPTRPRTHAPARSRTHAPTHTPPAHKERRIVCARTHARTHTHTHKLGVCVCMCVHVVHVCACVDMCAYVCVCVCMYVHRVCVYKYVGRITGRVCGCKLEGLLRHSFPFYPF